MRVEQQITESLHEHLDLTKEQAHDYRYFPEPDLPPLNVDDAWVADVRSRLPELPAARFQRFVSEYGLSPDDASTLTAEQKLADQYEEAVGGDLTSAKSVANWVINDGLGLARARGLDADQLPFSAAQLRELMDAVAKNEITMRAARELLPQLEAGESPRAAARRLNLLSLDDSDALAAAVSATIAANPAAVADYRGGKKAAIGRLIGETIKATGGRANPDSVRALLIEALEGGND